MSKPVPMGWLDTLVGVQWGSPFAVLEFQSVWVSDSRISPTVLLNVPGIVAPVNIFGTNGKSPLFQPTTPYHNETHITEPPFTLTTIVYNFTVTAPNAYGNGTITVTEGSDGSSFWTAGGTTGGPGNIVDAQAWFLSNGWSTFSSFETGRSSHTSSGPVIYTETDNAIFMFSRNAIANYLGKDATSLPISFNTGNGPVAVSHYPGAVSYTWKATFSLFSSAAYSTFKTDPTNLPKGWPRADSVVTQTSPPYPTPSQLVAFTIPL